MIGQTFSHCWIIGTLGNWRMGLVYKAEHTLLGRFAARHFSPEELAKDPPALEHFQREARAVSALNHPDICTVHDIGEAQGRPFIAVGFPQSRTAAVCDFGKRLNTNGTHNPAARIVDRSHSARSEGLLFREVKPVSSISNGGQRPCANISSKYWSTEYE